MDQIETTAEGLKKLIDDYRRRVAVAHDLYVHYEKLLSGLQPTEWAAAKRLLVALGRYWRGEIVRSRHNISRYILGEEPKLAPKYAIQTISDMDTSHMLEELEASIYEMTDTKINPALAQLAESYTGLLVSELINSAEYVERHTYGG